MRLIAFILVVLVFFSGCTKNDIEAQKQQCVKNGNKFTLEKTLNYRTGKMELRVYCI
jgi:outer membrane lipoprotein-sorting protein